jgi:hypothetical protein
MFYFLSKTLFYLLTPAGWLFFSLLGAIFLRNLRWRRRSGITALALFWLLGNGPLVNEGRACFISTSKQRANSGGGGADGRHG